MASVLSNGLSMLMARMMVPAFSFAINIGIARFYGPEMLGAYVYLLALALIFQTAAAAGLLPLLTRDLSLDPGRRPERMEVARRAGLVTGVVMAALFIAYSLTAVDPRWRLAALALAPTVLPSAWMAAQEALFLAHRVHHNVTWVALVENCTKLTLATIAFLAGGGLLAFCAAISVARLLAFAFGESRARRFVASSAARSSARDILGELRSLVPWALLFTVSVAYFRLDILIIESLMDEDAVGLYGAAASLFSILLLLPSSGIAALYPRMASWFGGSGDCFSAGAVLATKLLTFGVVPVTLALVWLGYPLVALVYGDAFVAAGPILVLLAISLPLHAFNGVAGHAIQAAGRPRAVLLVTALALMSHGALLAILVPAVGLRGGPFAMIGSSAVAAVGFTVVLQQGVLDLKWRSLVRGGFAASIVAMTVVGTVAVPESWTPGAAVLGCLILLTVLRSGLLTGDERRRIAGLLPDAPVPAGDV